MNPEEIRRLDLERDRLLQVNCALPGHSRVMPTAPGHCAVCGNLMVPGLCCQVEVLKKQVESLTWYLRYSLPQLEDLASRPDTLAEWAGHDIIKEIRELLGHAKTGRKDERD